MPEYDVRTVVSLTEAQQDELAERITHIHSTKFTTARLFVNVKFTDISKQRTYVGGKRHQGNHIFANVRVGPARTQEDWDDLSTQVVKAWNETVASSKSGSGREYELQSFIIMVSKNGRFDP
jgi:phenylpyruvate tautomerase PptA (4-oxalocrotonate tautomerase family)